MKEEIWKDVLGFEERYSVSSLGKVYSKTNYKIMVNQITKDGYCYFVAKVKGAKTYLYLHRQVALCFLDPPSPELVEKCSKEHSGLVIVNHIDGDKTNNRKDNLEWTDCKRNNQHNTVGL